MASIMNALSVFFLSLLLATSAQAALNGQCTANGKPGTCISTSACNSAGGTSVSGFCPNDPTDVKCCYKDSCDSGKGSCKWTSQCSGSSVPGYCPGPTNFQCCEAAGSPSNIYTAITTYADSHWNCIDPACSGTVQAGKAQEIFKCAEFVARSLAAGGFVPTLSSDSPRSAYESYVYGGKKYNLLWVSSKPPHGGPVGLEEFLIATGWHTVLPLTATNVHAGSVVFMNGWGHVAIGVGENLLDAHNMARKHVDLNFYSNFDLKAIYFK